MRRNNSVIKTLEDVSGASLIFVLGLMLLLMAIGVSSMAAAGANAGSSLSRQSANQINTYADSLQRSIMYSLQKCADDENKKVSPDIDPANSIETLGAYILSEVYNEAIDGFTPTPSISETRPAAVTIDVSPELAGGSLPGGESVSSSAVVDVVSTVVITGAVPAQDEVTDPSSGTVITPATDRQPQTAEIKGQVTVVVTVEHMGKSLISAATFNITNSLLDDSGIEGDMYIKDAGKWRLVSYERADKHQ